MKKLYGNTYEHKEKIRAEGGKWNADEKSWYVPAEKYEKLQEEIYPNFRKIQAEARIPKPSGEKIQSISRMHDAMQFAITEIVAEETQRDFFVVNEESDGMSFKEMSRWMKTFNLPLLSELAEKDNKICQYVRDDYRDFQASKSEEDVGTYHDQGDIFDRLIKKYEHFCDKEILRQTARAANRYKIKKRKSPNA